MAMSDAAATGPGTAGSWPLLQRAAALRAGIDQSTESRITLVSRALNRRPRQVAEAIRTGRPVVVVQAPLAFTAEQSGRLARLALGHRCLLVEWSASDEQRAWELGLGLDGTAETQKLVQISAIGALFPRFGRRAHGELLQRYLALLDRDSEAPNAGVAPPSPGRAASDLISAADVAAWGRLLELLNGARRSFDDERFRTADHAQVRAARRDAALEPTGTGWSARYEDRSPFSRPVPGRPRTIVVGAGMAATIHAGIAGFYGSITAVVSRTSSSAMGLASLHGAAALTTLDRADFSLADQVVVASPPCEHFPAAMRGIGAGLRVLVEKPLCSCLAEAERLVLSASKRGTTVVYGENWPYRPWLVAAARELRRHAPGHVEVHCRWPFPGHGDYSAASYGGGVLFDSGSHAMALVRLVLNPGRPVAVRAWLRFAPGSPNDIEADVNLEFGCGRTAIVRLSWEAQRPDVVAKSEGFVLRLAPAASLSINGRPVEVTVSGGQGPWVDGGTVGLHEALAGTREPEVPLATGAEDLEVITACYASAAHNGRLTLLPYEGDRTLTPAETFGTLSGVVL